MRGGDKLLRNQYKGEEQTVRKSKKKERVFTSFFWYKSLISVLFTA
jgi:hypothetical protein